jgi:lysophospholipase L1-like esterase
MIAPGSLVLFQGDSITDSGRDRNALEENHLHGLGHGYAKMVAARLMAERPNDGLRFRNLGISGHRIVDLYARWQEDAINLKPDMLSILIGVNDIWHQYKRGTGVPPAKFARVYRQLLEETREALPKVKLVLGEPFVLDCGAGANGEVPRGEVDAARDAVAALARDFGATLVRFQALFDGAVKQAPAEHWAGDGVHPTAAGHWRMAETWHATVCATGC